MTAIVCVNTINDPRLTATPQLTARDTCDAETEANVQARVRLTRDGKLLDLCQHHYRENSDALTAQGWMITDRNPV